MSEFELDMSEFLDLFIDESRQNLDALNQGLMALEQGAADDPSRTVEDVFRAAHTLKGMAATMGYEVIARLAHALEDALTVLRADLNALTPTLTTLVFRGIDAIELLVSDIASGGEGQGDIAPILGALVAYAGAPDAYREATAPGRPTDAVTLRTQVDVDAGQEAELSPEMGDLGDLMDVLAEETVPAEDLTSVALARSGPSRLVRLDVQRLDRLLDVVTEMVIHRSYLARLQRRVELPELDDALATHARLLDQLQTAVLATRMVPIGQAFDRFPRMVRDLLKSQGKEASFIIEGAQVELDRTMLAAINDALVHLLRNAVDHGLEPPDERAAAGKPTSGTVRLTARTERNTVVIEVTDDGRGMDAARIGRRARERGLVTQAALDGMSEGQVLNLLCEPGFSLAGQVTEVSGRGVGMDAVQAQVAAVRGRLEMETELGAGSCFRLLLPVNLALTDAVLVKIGDEAYAVPTSAVERVVEITSANVSSVGDRLLLSLDEGVLPLRHAGELLDAASSAAMPAYALLSRQHEQLSAIGIDAMLGYEQVVAKPTPPALASLPGLSGVTILGEGQVVFLLDLTQL